MRHHPATAASAAASVASVITVAPGALRVAAPPPGRRPRPAALRQIYHPRRDRLPRWVHRVWGWL
jgi:hypothetical protein